MDGPKRRPRARARVARDGREVAAGVGRAAREAAAGDHAVHDRTDAAEASGRSAGVFGRGGEVARVPGKEKAERAVEGTPVKMTRDELEFAISQYHDGDMPPLERAVVEEQLATNTEAREILAEYQRLDALMRDEP